MEIEVYSTCYIKPTIPTPNHLKIYKLSLLDQIFPPIYVPVILFYTNDSASIPSKKSLLLKQSLAQTLTRFYPFAGKIRDGLSIECDDEGSLYVEAKANCTLSYFLSQPDLFSLHKFLSGVPGFVGPSSGSRIVLVQETSFSCGSIAIGLLVSHMVTDGTGLSSFLKAWARAAITYGDEILSPSFDAPYILPQNSSISIESTMMHICLPFFKTVKSAVRRFIFNDQAISNIKANATNSNMKTPTRVQAVSAFLSQRIMLALNDRSSKPGPTLLTHFVNLRRQPNSPFSQLSIGNLAYLAMTLVKAEETELSAIVGKLNTAITKILDMDFVNNLPSDGGLIKHYGSTVDGTALQLSELHTVAFTSWCNFGLYETDFGWGKPAWVTCLSPRSPNDVFMNMVILMDMPNGKGIEAWIYLDEEDMIMLQEDKELLAYVSVDSTPLNH